jgi:hypothetical protein
MLPRGGGQSGYVVRPDRPHSHDEEPASEVWDITLRVAVAIGEDIHPAMNRLESRFVTSVVVIGGDGTRSGFGRLEGWVPDGIGARLGRSVAMHHEPHRAQYCGAVSAPASIRRFPDDGSVGTESRQPCWVRASGPSARRVATCGARPKPADPRAQIYENRWL